MRDPEVVESQREGTLLVKMAEQVTAALPPTPSHNHLSITAEEQNSRRWEPPAIWLS